MPIPLMRKSSNSSRRTNTMMHPPRVNNLQASRAHLSGSAGLSVKPVPSWPDPLPATSHDEAVCGSHSGDEPNNNESDKDGEQPRPMKRKQPSSSQDGPIHKKPKLRLQQRSTRQHRPHSKPQGRSPLDQGSTVAPVSTTGVIRDSCVERGVSFSQVVRFIASIGYVGKIDDFTIKPRHTSSRPSFGGTTFSTAAEARRDNVDATRIRPQEGKAFGAGALASRRSKPSISNNDGGLSDSDSESSSDDDGCSSEDEQDHKSWDWIFGKFPGRTPAAGTHALEHGPAKRQVVSRK
ncbi:hypothetical protein NA56DRAFT_703789 [Hyaloscypha hepaticicola]|uniref:Uncharacterized protein n=1 Tax=Hyaloscypha hepaticicola TaxID=2082293 RepID=A0A2J6Q4G2_9HELO|nr:hypothetical protein NA56DRAFT_703789 [Hyaloscypha hepaticicola]